MPGDGPSKEMKTVWPSGIIQETRLDPKYLLRPDLKVLNDLSVKVYSSAFLSNQISIFKMKCFWILSRDRAELSAAFVIQREEESLATIND